MAKGSHAWIAERSHRGRTYHVVRSVIVTGRGRQRRERWFRTHNGASRHLRRELARVARAHLDAPRTLDEATALYIGELYASRQSVRGIATRERELRTIGQYFDQVDPEIDPLTWDESDGVGYVDWRLAQGKSPPTVRSELRTGVGLQRFFVSKGWLPAGGETWAKVQVPRGKRGKATLTPAQMGRWLVAAERLARAPRKRGRRALWARWGAAAWIMAHGPRPGELVHLRIGDIDLQDGIVWIRDRLGAHTKTEGSDRGIPLLAQRAVDVLREVFEPLQAAGSLDAPAFVGPGGVGLTDDTDWFRRRALATCDAAKLPRVVPYGVRHSTVTGGALRGVGLGQMGRLVGHADPRTTIREYDHTAAVELRSALQPLGDALDAAWAAAGGEEGAEA